MINFDPIHIVDIGNVPLQTWGFFVGLGVVVATVVSMQNGKRRGIDTDHMFWFWFVSVMAGFLGARLSFVLLFLPVFRDDPVGSFRVWEGGLFLSTGLIVSFIAALAYIKIRKLMVWDVLDSITPSFVIFVAFERVGSFFIGQDPGKISKLPWSVVYYGASRHPIGIYQSIFLLGLSVIAFVIFYKIEKTKGYLFLSLSLIFVLGFFLFQFFISNDLTVSLVRIHGLTLFQYVYVVCFGVLLIVTGIKYRLSLTHG